MADVFVDRAWQRLCTAELERCLRLSRRKRVSAWSIARRHLLKMIALSQTQGADRPTRIILADFDVSELDLSGLDLSFCYIIRGKFVGSNLQKASFKQSIVTKCYLTRADISGGDLSRATIKDDVVGIDSVTYDDRTRLNVRAEFLNRRLPQFIINRVSGDFRRYEDRRRRSLIERAWIQYTNHGRAIGPILSLVLVNFFAFSAYYWFNIASAAGDWLAVRHLVDAMMLSSDSILGIRPSTEFQPDISWQVAFRVEATISLLLIALLIAALTHKAIEPASDV